MNSGRLTAIYLKRAHGGVMDERSEATLVTAKGLQGNADFGGRRQVTIISQERWNELMAEVHADLAPKARRANLVVSGINLENSRGRTLAIGPCVLRILG